MTENQFVSRRKFLERNCPYHLDNFCDGTPNKSVSMHLRTKETCPHFVNNTCTLQNPGIERE